MNCTHMTSCTSGSRSSQPLYLLKLSQPCQLTYCFYKRVISPLATVICRSLLVSRSSTTERRAGCRWSTTEHLWWAQLREKMPPPSSALTPTNSPPSATAPDHPPWNKSTLKVRALTQSLLRSRFLIMQFVKGLLTNNVFNFFHFKVFQ